MASQRFAPSQPGVTTLDRAAYDGADTDPYDAYAQHLAYDAPVAVDASATDVSSVPVFGPARGVDEPETPEWNPGEETLSPVRGRHRVRQRGGSIARSRAVLGVGVMAAVGAGGMATAHEGGPGHVPGMGVAADKVRSIPDQIPVLDTLLTPGSDTDVTVAPFTAPGMSDVELESGRPTDAGEALRARILQQADFQEVGLETAERTEAVEAAAETAAKDAAATAEAERIAERQRRAREAAERRRKAEEERLRRLRESYVLPLADYSITSGFGESGSMWSSTHTGTDFAAPTGTPIKMVHTGVVKEAAWAGSFGYRIVIELADGTELWFCHLSSMNVVAGQDVITGEVIGTVGSTGNSSGPHLHVEVHPGGGDAIDPLAWLRERGLQV